MLNYLDIAVPLVSNALTLFIGSGFSKYLTTGNAPSWVELLSDLTDLIDRRSILISKLFNTNKSGEVESCKLELSICAEILELEFRNRRKDIRLAVGEIFKNRLDVKYVDKESKAFKKVYFQIPQYYNERLK